MALKKYEQLGTVYRTEPCQEYPGTWFVYDKNQEKEKQESGFPTFEDAWHHAQKLLTEYDGEERDYPVKISICWGCSDNDPRVGQVWFTGFYQHGKFNQFGSYVQT